MQELKVIGMSLLPTQLDIVEFVLAGASGFILKDATVEDFLGTIRSVARGTKVLPPPMTGSFFSHVIERALKKGKGQLASAVRMTKRSEGTYSSPPANEDTPFLPVKVFNDSSYDSAMP
jgi:DNA-binding NarL/FixJ family response regulator